jgi:hypothetical protein
MTAKSVSGAGTNKGAINPSGKVMGASTEYQAPNVADKVGSFYPGIMNLGNRISADDPNASGQTLDKNFGQAFWGTVGNAVKNVAPGFNAKAQAYATNPAVTKSGVGSLSQPSKNVQAIASSPMVQKASNAIRSIIQSANPVDNFKKGLSQLRSLFKK